MTKHYATTILFLLAACITKAQPGAAESGFNSSGYVLASVPGKVNTGFEAGLAQPDGKIIAVGGADAYANDPYLADALIMRYNPDGSPDASFGTSGITITDIESTNDRFYAIALQPDGKIVAAGRAQTTGASDCAIVRYNTDGSPDSSFANGGKLRLSFNFFDDEINAVAIQPDGKIIIVGTNYYPTLDILVARLNANGSLDSSFGDQGKVFVDFNSSSEIGISVALQHDGKILAVGNAFGGAGSDIGVARLNTNGSFDTGFGTNGKVTIDIFGSQDDAGHSVVLQGNRIILGGWALLPASAPQQYYMTLVALNADGTRDHTFGDSNGIDTTDFGISFDFFYEAIVRGDKIFAAGSASQDPVQTSNENYDLAVAAYNSNGSLDQDFGTAGKVHSDFSGSSGLTSSEQAKDVFYYNNTLYAVGSAAHYTGEWDFTSYGVISAYQLDPVTSCYVDSITNLTASPSSLWPPNHKMKDVTLSYTLAGNCPDADITITSNEPQGNQADWEIIDDHHVRLRAERNGNGNGRIYTITVSGTGISGNTVSASVNVKVPRSPGHGLVIGQNENSSNALTQTFNAKILSNPSRTHFTLNIESMQQDPVEIKVYDISGKIVEKWSGRSNTAAYRFGYHYRPGTYIVEVIQKTERRNIKIIKLR